MSTCSLQENCKFHVKLRAGSSIISTKPVFTYNSQYLFCANGTHVKVYSIESGECVYTLRHHKSKVISLQVNKNNFLQVYSCSEDGVVACWDQTEGLLLKSFDMKQPVVCFYALSSSNWFVTKKMHNSEYHGLYSLVVRDNQIKYFKLIHKRVLPRENAVAFGCEGKVVAAIYSNYVCLYNLETEQFVKHFIRDRDFECITFHPSEKAFATGDSHGRVCIWHNIFCCKNPIKSLYHWHALPVADLVFSNEGSYLYSGGEEGALVKWNLNSEDKTVLPRLGAPIRKLTISSDNAYVLTAHQDNSFQVIDTERKVVQVIQGLVQWQNEGTVGRNNLSCGLLYDHISKALVMNGGPGRLQFFHAHEDKRLFSLDISGRNNISRDRENEVFNPDIQKAAFNDKCTWLSSVEYWSDGEASPQIWLKFWEYKDTKQTYVLNTNYFLPHYKEVNCIVFQPSCQESPPLAVTTSDDGKIKAWSLQFDPKFPERETWCCVSSGYYRDLAAGDACFSQDGSLLAVAFEDIITLWSVPNLVVKFVCFNENNTNNIKQIVFGRERCQHLLVSHDGFSFTIWNILSLSIIGEVTTGVQLIVPDLNSCCMACFSQDEGVYLFCPDSGEPAHYVGEISDKSIVAGVFVPKKELDNKEKSQLIFMDSDQNIYTLTDEDKEADYSEFQKKILINQNIPATPFGMLQAENRVSSVVKQEAEVFDEKILGEKDFVEIPNPTYVDLEDICSKYLKLMLLPRKKEQEEYENETTKLIKTEIFT